MLYIPFVFIFVHVMYHILRDHPLNFFTTMCCWFYFVLYIYHCPISVVKHNSLVEAPAFGSLDAFSCRFCFAEVMCHIYRVFHVTSD